MQKNIFRGIKNTADDFAVKKAKKLLIKNIEENGIHLTELLTPAVDAKLDELVLTIIKEHGYAKLASVGLKAHSKD